GGRVSAGESAHPRSERRWLGHGGPDRGACPERSGLRAQGLWSRRTLRGGREVGGEAEPRRWGAAGGPRPDLP
ncbi:unnamed protein product, partial [Effrenium voratum]